MTMGKKLSGDIFKQHTAADLLVDAASTTTAESSSKPDAKAPKIGRKRSRQQKQAAAPPASKTPRIEDEEADEPYIVTTVRLYQRHYDWLYQRALARKTRKGRGRVDSSIILRDVLDDVMSRWDKR
jgi:hypothetical protein